MTNDHTKVHARGRPCLKTNNPHITIFETKKEKIKKHCIQKLRTLTLQQMKRTNLAYSRPQIDEAKHHRDEDFMCSQCIDTPTPPF